MKQLTNNLLKMNFRGISLADVSKIEFAFSQNIGDAPLKTATYPGDNVVQISDTMLGVVWSVADTQLFEADKAFYADTRITLMDSSYQPATPIVKLKMNPTLFER